MSANDTADVYEIARELRDAVGDMKGSIEKRLRALERGRGGEGFAPEDVVTVRASMLAGSGGVQRGFAAWLQGILVEGDPVKGGYLVPPDHASEVWEMIGSASIGLESGFTVIPTSSDELHLPTVTDAGANWVAEASPIPQTDPLLGEVVARPRKLGAYVALSNELISDSTPAALQVVSDSFTRALGRELDKGFFVGSGTAPEILGLFNKAGIVTVPGGGAIANLDSITAAIAALEANDLTATAIYMHPGAWADYLALKEATGSIRPLLTDTAGVAGGVHRSILGVPVYVSSQLPPDMIGVAQADQVVAVRREEARVEVSRDVGFREDVSAMRAISRWDIALPNAKAFVAITGVSGVTLLTAQVQTQPKAASKAK